MGENMVMLASTVDTKIYVSDYERFHIFLFKEGFQNVKIIYSPKSSFLKLQFESFSDSLSYQKHNIEKRFLLANSKIYYYDLDY